MGYILGLYWGIYWGYIGVMENKMETTTYIMWRYIEKLGLYWGSFGITENEMESTIMGYTWV